MTESSTLDPQGGSEMESREVAPADSAIQDPAESAAPDNPPVDAPGQDGELQSEPPAGPLVGSEEAVPDRPREAAPDREPPPPPEEVAATAKEFLTGVLEVMGLEAEISTSISDTGITVDVGGEAMGVLIGRRGQTLDALQELARTAVQRRLRARVRLVVDVEGYRARRRDSLADYARSMADRARARGTEIELEPMSAYERKVVHDAVGEVSGASSYSEGEEPNRKVIIRGE